MPYFAHDYIAQHRTATYGEDELLSSVLLRTLLHDRACLCVYVLVQCNMKCSNFSKYLAVILFLLLFDVFLPEMCFGCTQLFELIVNDCGTFSQHMIFTARPLHTTMKICVSEHCACNQCIFFFV